MIQSFKRESSNLLLNRKRPEVLETSISNPVSPELPGSRAQVPTRLWGREWYGITFALFPVSLICAWPLRFGSRCPMGRPSGKGIQDSLDSEFHGGRFRILSQWILYSRFQSLAVFRNPWAVFWTPDPRISDSTSKDFPSSISAIDILWLSTFLRANRLDILDQIVTWIHVNLSLKVMLHETICNDDF